MLRHVVMFKFKETSTEADVARIVKAFGALPERIKEIKGFEWGTDNSPEGLQQGLTHCFFVTFDSEADRDAYLPHPAHKEFVDLVGPPGEKVTVVDYWAKPGPCGPTFSKTSRLPMSSPRWWRRRGRAPQARQGRGERSSSRPPPAPARRCSCQRRCLTISRRARG